jgi:hypothetical protein
VWGQGSRAAGADEALAGDGQALRGAGAEDNAAPPFLAVATPVSAERRLHVRGAAKTNASPVAREVGPARPLAGRGVTAAALHLWAQTAPALREQEAA